MIHPPRLIAGPYRPPRPRRGRVLFDLLRGDLVVHGTSDAPVPWPVARTSPKDHQPTPVMTDELVRAVRTEVAAAICHWFGVNRWRVSKWRRALGVPRGTPGTVAIWRELARIKLTPEARVLGNRRMKEAIAARHEAAAGRSDPT